MTHRLTTDYAKNYCKQTLNVKVTVENVVTCFYGTQCILFVHRITQKVVNGLRIKFQGKFILEQLRNA